MYEIKSICIFCGASNGFDPCYRDAAVALGRSIAESGRTLVFGGGNAGLMGATADAALASGGRVIGVIPSYLIEREHGHRGLTELKVVDSMHSRKETMFALSDAFVVLPGGVGTLDETFEIITWKQLDMHDKPIVVVDIAGYWKRLDELIAATVTHGFAAPPTRDLYVMVPTVADVLPTLDRLPRRRLRTDPARL